MGHMTLAIASLDENLVTLIWVILLVYYSHMALQIETNIHIVRFLSCSNMEFLFYSSMFITCWKTSHHLGSVVF